MRFAQILVAAACLESSTGCAPGVVTLEDNATGSTALALSNVAVSSVGPTSVVISWSTNLTSTSMVQYGATSSYGTTTPLYGLTLNHEVPLTGLLSGTTYHYAVTSSGARGTVVTSADATFTTLPAGSGGSDGGLPPGIDAGVRAADGGIPDAGNGTPDAGPGTPDAGHGSTDAGGGNSGGDAGATNQLWTGIVSPSRAVDWSEAGVPGGIPTSSTVCATLNPGATQGAINAALSSAACSGGTASNPKVVFLNAGTYALSGGIEMNGLNHVVLRGAGADQTVLAMSGSGGCNGQAADVCILTPDNNWFGAPDNQATFSGAGPWPKGTTQVTLSNVSNLRVGSIVTFDQVDDLTDTGSIYVCEESPSARPGQSPNCNEDNGGAGGESGAQRDAPLNPRGQQQIVTVTGISGNTVTFSPGLYMPNWRSSQTPGAWWDSSPVSGDGVEDLAVQHATGNLNIFLISNCVGCWLKGVEGMRPDRSHVSIWTSAHVTIRDSYFFQTANGASQSYGVETFGASDVLEENNIFQQVAGPQMFNSDCEGCVAAYNFSVNDYFSQSFDWLQQSVNFHSSTQFILLEGNVGSGLYSDRFHGTSHFATLFRNRFDGFEHNGTASPTSHTNPVILYPLSRYFNIVGNVLGTVDRPHITYENVPGSSPNPDQTIFIVGTGASYVADDSLTASSLLRWGNYDVATGSAHWSSTEVPSGLALYGNAMPSSQGLPPSFRYASRPAWWPAGKPWPAIGPDVSGGNIPNVAGHAFTLPAEDCFFNVMGGPADGSGGVRPFNAASCY